MKKKKKNRTKCCKDCFEKKIQKTAEATRELMGIKIAEKIVKPHPLPDMNSRNVEEIVISPEKRQETSNESRKEE